MVLDRMARPQAHPLAHPALVCLFAVISGGCVLVIWLLSGVFLEIYSQLDTDSIGL